VGEKAEITSKPYLSLTGKNTMFLLESTDVKPEEKLAEYITILTK